MIAPVGPVGPVAPVPVAPVGPVGPVGPVAPVPVAPVEPVGPVGPVTGQQRGHLHPGRQQSEREEPEPLSKKREGLKSFSDSSWNSCASYSFRSFFL